MSFDKTFNEQLMNSPLLTETSIFLMSNANSKAGLPPSGYYWVLQEETKSLHVNSVNFRYYRLRHCHLVAKTARPTFFLID